MAKEIDIKLKTTADKSEAFKAKRKNIARRKERRKEREAAKRNATYWAKRNVPRELRAWLDF
jgi:hypothetical protein